MSPRRRKADWRWGFLWGIGLGALLTALVGWLVLSGEETERIPERALARAPVATPHRMGAKPQAAPKRDTTTRVANALPTHAPDALPPPPTSSHADPALTAVAESEIAPAAPHEARQANKSAPPEADARLVFRGKVTRMRGGWLKPSTFFAALAKTSARTTACQRASTAKHGQDSIALRLVLLASGRVESVRPIKAQDARLSIFDCARDTLQGARFAKPRGGSTDIEAVLLLQSQPRRPARRR